MRVAYVNRKGGVGKTTGAMFTAAGLARHGRTLLVDCDPDASAQLWAEQAGEALGFAVVGLVHGVEAGARRLQHEGGYAHVVIDTPPGRSSEEIIRAALRVADVAVMPLAPSTLDAARLKPTADLIVQVAQEHNPDMLMFALLNRVRAGTTMSKVVADFLTDRKFPTLPPVPLREVYVGAFGLPITDLGDWAPVVDTLRREAA